MLISREIAQLVPLNVLRVGTSGGNAYEKPSSAFAPSSLSTCPNANTTISTSRQFISHLYTLNLKLDTNPEFNFHYLSDILSFA